MPSLPCHFSPLVDSFHPPCQRQGRSIPWWSPHPLGACGPRWTDHESCSRYRCCGTGGLQSQTGHRTENRTTQWKTTKTNKQKSRTQFTLRPAWQLREIKAFSAVSINFTSQETDINLKNKTSPSYELWTNIVAIMEFLRKSLSGDYWIFVVSDQGKDAASTGIIWIFIRYPENAKYSPNKNCMSCSRQKIVWKLAYLRVKMTSLIQKRIIIKKVAYYSV